VPNYTHDDGRHSAVKNLLGARKHDELEALEAPLVFARLVEIQSGRGPAGNFDAGHLRAIHRHLFQDVYEWAGHTRDEKVRLQDGTVASEPLLRKVDGDLFMLGPLIPDALARVGATLRAADHLRGLPREEFAERAADIMIEINTAHPFREGNGRTQRAFVELLADGAGHELDFSVVSRERMIQASIAATNRDDPSMMRRMFDEISDPARVAALLPAIESFDRQGFDWNDRYLATTQPGHEVELTMAGVAGHYFMARTSGGILIGQVTDLPNRRPGRGATFILKPGTWPRAESYAQN
jgi:cell filamentation protein